MNLRKLYNVPLAEHRELLEQHIIHQTEEGNSIRSEHGAFDEGNRRTLDRRVEDRRRSTTDRRVNSTIAQRRTFDIWVNRPNAELKGRTPIEVYPSENIAAMRIGWYAACDNV